ncbi:unnamed protein product [Xylocopa violacea]
MQQHIISVWHNAKSIVRTGKQQSSTISSIETEYIMSKSKHFSINIVSSEGKINSFTVTSDMSINKVKAIAMKYFYNNDTSRNIINFRLVQSSKFKWLIDDSTLTDEQIYENDELMLTKIRSSSINENLSDEALKGPSEQLISQVTKVLPICNPPKQIPFLHCPADFQNEVRKILITLIKASAKIILYSPEAQKLCDILKEKLEARCKPNINPNTVKLLTEMGYTEKKVFKALRLRKSNMMEAIEWLTEHQNDSEDDFDDDDSDLVSVEKECQSLKNEENILHIVDHLLESYHRYKKMDFKPSPKALQLLLEMGFEEKSIIEALKITGNNQTNACEWLLGERRYSLQDLNKELDSDSPIYKAIMMDPRIQLSLINPHMLLVYLSMLETPVAIGERIRDPEIGPILDHIIATYHAEKHAIYMNQYVIDF